MTRKITDKYVAWISGYYDDFNGSQCIADDKNSVDSFTIDHTLSHAGNTINGEAVLNPTYRYSVIERQSFAAQAGGGSHLTNYYPVSTHYGKSEMGGELHNNGVHEFITKDTIRLGGGENWEGRATSRSPQSFFHQNRATTATTTNAMTGATSADGYMMVNNPYRTGTKYYYPIDNDGSYGRSDIKDYSATSGSNKHSQAGNHIDIGAAASSGASMKQVLRREAYMTGMFQWQSFARESANLTHREGIGVPITSLGGKPFMVLDTKWFCEKAFRTFATHGEQILMLYDGTLNAMGNKDRFHIRLCAQSFSGLETTGSFDDANVKTKSPLNYLSIGFDSETTTFASTGVTKTADGSASNPAIKIEIDWSTIYTKLAHALYNKTETVYSKPAGLVSTDAIEMEDMWVDFDVVMDFTNQSYQLFVNGTASGAVTAFTASPDSSDWTPSQFYGWKLSCLGRDFDDGHTQNNTNVYAWQQIIMVDRVAFGRNVTHHLGKTASAGGGAPAIATLDTAYPSGHSGTPVLTTMSYNMASNSFSDLSVEISDDANNLDIYPLISGGGSAEYLFMIARNNDDRFIMSGNINSVRVRQIAKQQNKTVSISCTDPAKLLDRQIPTWDIGQGLFSDDTDKSIAKRGSAEALSDALYFGAVRLSLHDDSIGFEKYSSASASSLDYLEKKDQRTTLHSAHPIQLYNNEDASAPNDVELNWLYKRSQVLFPMQNADGSLVSSKTGVSMPSHGLAATDTVNIYGTADNNTSIDGTNKLVDAVTFDSDSSIFSVAGGPPSANAQTTYAVRWEQDGSSTDYAAFLLDAGSFSTIPENLELGSITFNKTGTYISGISNDVFELYGIEKVTNYAGTGFDYYLFTNVPWAKVNSSATYTGLSAFTSGAGPWNVYWDYGYFDLHTTSSGTTFNTDGDFALVKNRVNHAMWMRDLPKSLWFKKMFGKIDETPAYAGLTTTSVVVPASTNVFTDIGRTGAIEAVLDAGGVAELVTPQGVVDSFSFSGATNSGGYIRLDGCKFISLTHAVGSTIRIRTISDDYKHIWVLWADMRNNGEANADGHIRKNSFGLLHPTPDNYSLTLQYTDQEDIDGVAINYIDLAIGMDCDIWECDAEIEPYSGNSWSSLGSDALGDAAHQNWEDKAGAFLIIDFSKFFNLNTESNGGRAGQKSGGRKTLGDLVVETEGHPALIDDYWQEAAASPKTVRDGDLSNHPNWYNFFSAGSNMSSNTYAQGSNAIVLDDTSEFPSKGIGMVEIERTSGNTNTQERNLLFYYWGANNTSTNTLSNIHMFDLDETQMTLEEIKSRLFNAWRTYTQSAATTTGIPFTLKYNDSINNITDGYDKIVFYSGISAPLALRFQLGLNGFIESREGHTFYSHDKLRALGVLANSETHLSQFTMPITFSIKNCPITRRMTTTQTTVDGSTRAYTATSGGVLDWDSYGGISDARGKSVLAILTDMGDTTKVGSENSTTIFTYVTGRDGRIDFRPAYSSGHVFTRDNLRISDIVGSPTAAVSNVRIFYNNGSSFVDYPTASKGTELRWKMLELPNVVSHREALAIAKSTYEKSKVSPLRITASPTIQSTESDLMLFGARHGYIQDPALRSVNTPLIAGLVAQGWTSWWNGIHFSGMQNALDGNISWMGSTLNSYNRNTTGHTNGGGVSYINTGDEPAKHYYGWVGLKSVSDAVQIVHIPKNMPKTSNAAAGQQLRVGIQLAQHYDEDEATPEDVEFYLALYDPNTSFSDNSTGHSITDDYGSRTFLKFKHSGFYEVEIPSTYWTGANGATGNERIIVSINAEYLRSLLRHRNGKPTSNPYYANKEDMPGFNTSTYRAYSPFPLGIRNIAGIPTAQDAPVYFAPRISVVDDINFYPSTKVTYTDANLGLSNPTPFSIKSVNWAAQSYDIGKLTLMLEQDESKALPNLASYILPEINKGRTPGTIPYSPQPSPGGGGGGSGPGGGGGYRPPLAPPLGGGPVLGPVLGEGISLNQYTPVGNRNFAGVSSGDIAGQMLGSNAIGVNNTTPDLMNRISGKMDMHNQYGLQDGDFSILGSKNSGAPTQVTKAVEGADIVWDKKRGSIVSKEGAVFPGLTDNDADTKGFIHQHTLRVTVPSDVMGQQIVVSGISSLDAASGSVALFATLECVETGASMTSTVSLESPFSNRDIAIISGPLSGAETPGNTIKLTLRRQANQGQDTTTAQYCSVVLHKVDVKFVRAAISGRSDTYRFLGLKNGGTRNL